MDATKLINCVLYTGCNRVDFLLGATQLSFLSGVYTGATSPPDDQGATGYWNYCQSIIFLSGALALNNFN